MSMRVSSHPSAGFGLKELLNTMWKRVLPEHQGFQSPFSERKTLLIIFDLILVFFAARLSFQIVELVQGVLVEPIVSSVWYWTPILMLWWFALTWLNDLYHVPTSHKLSLTWVRLSVTALMGCIVYYGLRWLMPFDLPQSAFYTFLLFALPTVAAWRYLYIYASKTLRPFQQRVLIIGNGKRGKTIANLLRDTFSMDYHVIGFLDDQSGAHNGEKSNFPLLGQVGDIDRIVNEQKIDQIVVALDTQVAESLFHTLVHWQANGVLVSSMPNLYEKLCHKVPIEHIDAAWGLQAMQDKPIFDRVQLAGKRLLDLLLCVLSAPVFLFVMPLIAVAIRLDSPGPIFYKQVRSGRGGKAFEIFKFRTMTANAEKNGQAVWATKNDMRITRVGRLLRKARLDELPQILNILRGEMSFVGPRPERPEFVAQLQETIPYFHTRLMVKPGLTGWAQVNYDYGNTVDDAMIKLQYDFYYVQYWSLWLDLYILFRTVSVIVQLKGI